MLFLQQYFINKIYIYGANIKKNGFFKTSFNKVIYYFIQINIGNESQKSGIDQSLAKEFINFCKFELKLNIIGLMCIPPANVDPFSFFKKMQDINTSNNLIELSMGMSADYKEALSCKSTFVRIGSAIFN